MHVSRYGSTGSPVRPTIPPGTPYLVQEGLPLATFLGNRLDPRAPAQKARPRPLGAGRAGGAYRAARKSHPIAGPRRPRRPASRGRAAGLPGALAGGPDDVHRVLPAAAETIDRAPRPRCEIGVDIAVLQDGTIKVIQVNGAPRKTSLEALRDPLLAARVYRLPIHDAIGLALRGDG